MSKKQRALSLAALQGSRRYRYGMSAQTDLLYLPASLRRLSAAVERTVTWCEIRWMSARSVPAPPVRPYWRILPVGVTRLPWGLAAIGALGAIGVAAVWAALAIWASRGLYLGPTLVCLGLAAHTWARRLPYRRRVLVTPLSLASLDARLIALSERPPGKPLPPPLG